MRPIGVQAGGSSDTFGGMFFHARVVADPFRGKPRCGSACGGHCRIEVIAVAPEDALRWVYCKGWRMVWSLRETGQTVNHRYGGAGVGVI